MGMTIKVLAENLNVSKTTIAKIIKRLNIEPERMEYNRQQVIFLSDEEIKLIKAEYEKRHPKKPQTENTANSENVFANQNANGTNPTNVSENPTNETKNTTNYTTNETENATNGAKTESANTTTNTTDSPTNGTNPATLDALIKQLAEKDKQISNLTQALMQEQQLHARTQNQLLELKKTQEQEQVEPVPAEPVPESQEEKKGFWQRLFNK